MILLHPVKKRAAQNDEVISQQEKHWCTILPPIFHNYIMHFHCVFPHLNVFSIHMFTDMHIIKLQ